MTYLLDTHTLLWSLFSTRHLSPKVKEIFFKTESEVLVSAISLWEISLKYSIRKLYLFRKKPEEIPLAIKEMGFGLVALTAPIAASFHRLPLSTHKDPFDRMLVWQAISQKYTLVSRDRELRVYKRHGLKLIW